MTDSRTSSAVARPDARSAGHFSLHSTSAIPRMERFTCAAAGAARSSERTPARHRAVAGISPGACGRGRPGVDRAGSPSAGSRPCTSGAASDARRRYVLEHRSGTRRIGAALSRVARERRSAITIVGMALPHARERTACEDATLKIIRMSHVPVLAVPPSTDRLPRRALVAVDFSATSRRAAATALALLRSRGTLTLAHVQPDSISKRWGVPVSMRSTRPVATHCCRSSRRATGANRPCARCRNRLTRASRRCERGDPRACEGGIVRPHCRRNRGARDIGAPRYGQRIDFPSAWRVVRRAGHAQRGDIAMTAPG